MPHRIADLSIRIQADPLLPQETDILRAQFRLLQQVGTAPGCPQQTLLTAPFVDLRMVAGEQHFRDFPAAEYRRAGIVGIFQ